MWSTDKYATGLCTDIWKVIFFINNFIGDPCFSVGWYLYVDMQLYVMSMPILLLFKYNSKVCKILIWALILIGMVQLFIYCQLTGYLIPIRLQDLGGSPTSFKDQYSKPWQWMAAYFIGLFFGILYY